MLVSHAPEGNSLRGHCWLRGTRDPSTAPDRFSNDPAPLGMTMKRAHRPTQRRVADIKPSLGLSGLALPCGKNVYFRGLTRMAISIHTA